MLWGDNGLDQLLCKSRGRLHDSLKRDDHGKGSVVKAMGTSTLRRELLE